MITRENYEIYYLDYLEGNLSDIKKDELLLFLEKNTDLKVDETPMPAIYEEQEYTKKNELKVTDFSEEISTTNVEDFIIAAQENILPKKQLGLLHTFLNNNKKHNKLVELYKHTILSPNLFEVYRAKKNLYKKEKRVVWPWVAAASISILVLLNLSLFSSTEEMRYSKSTLTIDVPEIEDKIEQPQNIIKRTTTEIRSKKPINKNSNVKQIVKRNTNAILKEKIDALAYKKLNIIPNKLKKLPHNRPNPNSALIAQKIAVVKPSNSKKMNNPFWVLTDIAGSLTDTEIDYRRAKKEKNKTSDFKLKIGDFEIYKNSF